MRVLEGNLGIGPLKLLKDKSLQSEQISKSKYILSVMNIYNLDNQKNSWIENYRRESSVKFAKDIGISPDRLLLLNLLF